MDGGIKRHFRLEHCRRFSADLDAVKAFFLEGLPDKVVDSCTRRLAELLKQLFEKDTACVPRVAQCVFVTSCAGTSLSCMPAPQITGMPPLPPSRQPRCGACRRARPLTAPCRYNIFRVIRHRTKEDATAKVVCVLPPLKRARAYTIAQKFIDKFKADIEARNFIKHLKPH